MCSAAGKPQENVNSVKAARFGAAAASTRRNFRGTLFLRFVAQTGKTQEGPKRRTDERVGIAFARLQPDDGGDSVSHARSPGIAADVPLAGVRSGAAPSRAEQVSPFLGR